MILAAILALAIAAQAQVPVEQAEAKPVKIDIATYDFAKLARQSRDVGETAPFAKDKPFFKQVELKAPKDAAEMVAFADAERADEQRCGLLWSAQREGSKTDHTCGDGR